MKKEEFIFCPLGGSGEIGMNMNLFAYGNEENKKWIIVDIGVTFADDTIPGVDLIYPDPGFIVEKKDDLLGLVLTHAHEDHIGAIAHIWPKLLCDIYATPFTSVLIQEKFKEKKIDIKSYLKIVELNSTIKLSSALKNKIKLDIKMNCSPKHVPSFIYQTPDIPYTINGKKVELAVKNILEGKDVNNKDALSNPECLEFYKNIKIS